MRNADTAVVERADTPSTALALYRARGGGKPVGLPQEAPLLLGHALGSSKNMWDEVLALLPCDLPVILWEQPGHGGSGLLEVNSPSALDTAAAMRAGLDDLGVGTAHVAGLSLGGMTTLAFAQCYPQHVASFAVLDSGAASPPSQPWLDRADQVEADGLTGLVDGTMERWFTPSFAEEEGRAAVERIRQIFLQTNPAGYAQCCRILANTDLRSELSVATPPALVLTGADDPGMTPEQARDLASGLPNVSEVVVVDRARHLTAVERPEVVCHALLTMIGAATAA